MPLSHPSSRSIAARSTCSSLVRLFVLLLGLSACAAPMEMETGPQVCRRGSECESGLCGDERGQLLGRGTESSRAAETGLCCESGEWSLTGRGSTGCDNTCGGPGCFIAAGNRYRSTLTPCDGVSACTSDEECWPGSYCFDDGTCIPLGCEECIAAEGSCTFDTERCAVTQCDLPQCGIPCTEEGAPCGEGASCMPNSMGELWCLPGNCQSCYAGGQLCGFNRATCEFTGCTGCVASCEGRECGSDGCEGSCGTCSAGQVCDWRGACCTPDCDGRSCGSDGCGGTCGTCPSGESCDSSGACACRPSCSGRSCGPDGCGGSCGTCSSGQTCSSSGRCQAPCTPSCSGRSCGSDGCGGSCGTCPSGRTCSGGSCTGSTGGCTVVGECLSVSRWLTDASYCRTVGAGTRDVMPVLRNSCSASIRCKVCGLWGSSLRECHTGTWAAGDSIGGWATDYVWCDADSIRWQCTPTTDPTSCFDAWP